MPDGVRRDGDAGSPLPVRTGKVPHTQVPGDHAGGSPQEALQRCPINPGGRGGRREGLPLAPPEVCEELKLMEDDFEDILMGAASSCRNVIASEGEKAGLSL